jgi:hypothetical protein
MAGAGRSAGLPEPETNEVESRLAGGGVSRGERTGETGPATRKRTVGGGSAVAGSGVRRTGRRGNGTGMLGVGVTAYLEWSRGLRPNTTGSSVTVVAILGTE